MQFFQYAQQINRLERSKENHIDVMKKFLKEIGDPHKKIKNVIHVAGTNGKGSVCSFIRSILEKSGYTVNVYTSPHLCKINERIRIRGKLISTRDLKRIDNLIAEKIGKYGITLFEALTIAAVIAFKEKPADFNIFEAGLGGRLDATNIFQKKLASVITSISYDHIAILGDTLEKIAFEKISIVEETGTSFISKQNNNALKTIKKFLETKKSVNHFENENWKILKKDKKYFYNNVNEEFEIKPSLKGEHQFYNAGLATTVSKYISDNGYKNITNKSIQDGISNAYWPGRIQNLNMEGVDSEIIIDGAHNEDGIEKLMQYVTETKDKYSMNIAFFATLENKNILGLGGKLKDNFDHVYITSSKTDQVGKKFQEPKKIIKELEKYNVKSSSIKINFIEKTIREKLNNKNYRILFFGSLYFIGNILQKYERSKIR